ncbi:hypothetical protein MNBD_GAMMA21-2718 [hydrothermal vent metagenome]|uniref:ASPIC/UnbV domain-containing protein n=1 Tax=hydrothermal vent metagenome TaxID=652676 RepID=A0A3B1AYZ9_9ZZZZ
MKIIKLSLIGILASFILGNAYFFYAYRGVAEEGMFEMRYGTIDEIFDYINMVWYIGSHYEKLTYNDSGSLNFDNYEKQLEIEGNDFEKGEISFHQGNFSNAVALIESDIKHSGESEQKLFWLAMSAMRQGEAQNCLARLKNPAQTNIFSLQHSRLCTLPVSVFHNKINGSSKAIRIFEKLLSKYDSGNLLYKWLLNFSYMTINQFPAHVPEKHRIDTEFIDHFYGEKKAEMEHKYRNIIFQDKAHKLGVNELDAGKGVAVEDFDGDGYLDLVIGGSFSPVKYFRNDAGDGFTDITKEAGLEGLLQAHIITAADYDNDGNMDLFFSLPPTHFRLFKNKGDGTFRDVTIETNLLKHHAPKPKKQYTFTWLSAWGDIDNDGDLDLFLAQRGLELPYFGGVMAMEQMDSILYLNEGNQFVDATEQFGLNDIVKDRGYVGGGFGDIDQDGYPELFLTSWTRTRSMMLQNVAGKRFEKTDQLNLKQHGFMAGFLDINHDGWLDVFIGSGNVAAATVTAQTVFGIKGSNNMNTILINNKGRLEEHPEYFRANMPAASMGASYGDINNDGCYDFYIGTGNPEAWHVLPNLMYIGESDGTRCTGFADNISMLNGFGTVQKGHGIVFFDYDNDGDQDIYSSLGGMWPSDAWPNQLFVNDSRPDNTWVKFRLRGRETNYFGLGAEIVVTAEDQDKNIIIRRYNMNNKTGFGSAPYLAHIGLMNAHKINKVEVKWPVSRKITTYQNIDLKQLYYLDENGTQYM